MDRDPKAVFVNLPVRDFDVDLAGITGTNLWQREWFLGADTLRGSNDEVWYRAWPETIAASAQPVVMLCP